MSFNSKLKRNVAFSGGLLARPFAEKESVETRLFKDIDIIGIDRAEVAGFMQKQAEKNECLCKHLITHTQ